MPLARRLGLAVAVSILSALFAPSAEAGRFEDQEKVKAIEARLGAMFGRLNDKDPQRRAAAHEVFRSYRVSDEDYALFDARYRRHDRRRDVDLDDPLERTVDVFGVVLEYQYRHFPIERRLDAAWREYFRFLEHPSPRVRAIAYRHAAASQIVSNELLPAALAGCAEPTADVRTGAFWLLGRILRDVPSDHPRLAEARELVSRALREDREVRRGGLFVCAGHFGAAMRPHSAELFAGLYGEFRFEAAIALAAVDSSSAMIDQVVASMSAGDERYEGAAGTYFNFLPVGRGAKNAALVAKLAEQLVDHDPERRLATVILILRDDFPTLRQAALAEAERLMPLAPEHHYAWRGPLAYAVYHCGLKHPEARLLMLRFMRHPVQEIRFDAHHEVLGQFTTAAYYRAEIAHAAEHDPDPECRRIARLTLDALDRTMQEESSS